MSNTESTHTEPDHDAAQQRGMIKDFDRRSLLKGFAAAGAGAVVAPLLAACGGSSNDSTDDPSSGPTSSSPPATTPSDDPPSSTDGGSGGDVLTPVADVPVGGGVILAKQQTVVTQPTKGTFVGFSSTCTHMGCTVAKVSGGTIQCPCHGSQFSIEDGTPIQGPNGQPPSVISALPKKSVKVDGANVVSA